MSEDIESRIIGIIQDTLNADGRDVVVTAADSMETIPAWDSLTFMKVFLAINEAFDVSPDFDDAIHYTSVRTLHEFLREQLA